MSKILQGFANLHKSQESFEHPHLCYSINIYPGSVTAMGLIRLRLMDPASSQKGAGEWRDEQEPQGWTENVKMQLGEGRKNNM